MGVITKPSSVQRSGIVRLLVTCGMAAGCGGAHSQRAPRGAGYHRHGLLPRVQHALLLTQRMHKKQADTVGQPPCAVTTHNTLRGTRLGFGGYPRGQPPYLTPKG